MTDLQTAERLTRPLVLVGCGKMGGAMLDGWLKSGIAGGGVHIVDPGGAAPFKGRDGVTIVADAADLPDGLDPEVVIFAVKPQQMDDTVPAYTRFVGGDCFFLSVAAGRTIAYFEDKLSGDREGNPAVVRAMPNTPAAIGQGITVACPNAACTEAQADMAETLLRAVGEAARVEDESLLDAVTALSGGGPAYTFLLVETMAKAGIAAGLPEELSARLALVTVAGAGQLALSSEDDPAQLRKNVTSPGGTTQQALAVLMDEEDGLESLMRRAIAAATKRSKELAG